MSDLSVIPAGTANDPVLSASVSVCGVQLATGATLDVPTGLSLTLSGSVDCSGTAQITGAGELRLAGTVVATLGANSLALAVDVQSGSVTFAATTISGRLTVSGGVATTSGAVVLNGAAPSLALSGGTLSVGGTTTATNGAESSGVSGLAGAGTLVGSLAVTGGTLTVSPAATPTVTGAIDVQVATLLVGSGATLTAGNAMPAVSVQSGGALIVAGVLTAVGTVEATGTTSFGGSGDIAGDLVVLSGVATVLGDPTPANASDLTVDDVDVQDGAGLSIGSNAMLHATGTSGATFTGTTTLSGDGSLDGDVATVMSAGTDTLSSSGGVSVTGALTVAAGTTLDVANSFFVAGDVTVEATGVLDGSGSLTLDGVSAVALDVSGMCDVPLIIAKSSGVDVVLTPASTVLDNKLTLNGGRLFVAAGKTLTINEANPAMFVTRGEFAVDGDLLAGSPAGGVQASGTAIFSGVGAIDPIVTVAGGTASTEVGSALDFSATIINDGAAFTLNGGATFSGTTAVHGSLNVAASSTFNGAIDVLSAMPFSSIAVFTVSGGATVAATAATPSITVAGGGAGGQVIVDVGGTLTAANDARATAGGEYAIAGTLDVGASVLDLNASLLSGAGSVLGAGGVDGSAGASTVSFTGSIAGVLQATGGTLTITGTPSAGSVAVQAGATLAVTGTVSTTGAVDVVGSGALNGAGVLTMAPNATMAGITVSPGGTCDVDLVFAATGVGGAVVLANPGANTTLGGDVTVSGGMFQIPNGKTLDVGGLFSVVGATLDLDGSLTSAGGAEVSNGAVLTGTMGSFGPLLTATAGTSTLAAAAMLTFGRGVAVSGGAVLVLDGAAAFASATVDGTLQVVGAGSSVTGTTSVSGLLDVDESFTTTGTTTVATGGNVNVAATKTLTAGGSPGVTLAGGALVLDGALAAVNGLRGSDGAQLSGGGTFGGAINAAAPGAFTFVPGATVLLGGPLDVDSGATFVLGATATFSSATVDGTFQIDASGSSVVGAATVSSTGLLDVNESFTVGGLLTVTGGDVDVAATKTLTASAAGVAATAGATLTIAGQLDIGAFLLALNGSNLSLPGSGSIPGASGVTFDGTCTLAGPGSIAGPMAINSGTTSASGGAMPLQGFSVAVGATLTLLSGLATPGDVNVAGVVNGAGTLTMNPSAANANLDVTGTYGGNLQIAPTGGFAVLLGAAPVTTIGGDVTVSSGVLVIGVGKTLSVGDRFLLQGAGLVLTGGMPSNGTLTAVNGALTSGTSTLDGAGGNLSAALSIGVGTTTLVGGSSLTFSRGLSVLNGATFVVDAAASFSTASVDGLLDLNVGPTFGGALTVTANGTVDVAAGQTLTANGTPGVSVTGGDFVLDGVLVAPNGVVLANGAALSGAGSYSGSIQASAPGTSTLQTGSTLTLGGVLTVDASATFDVAAAANFASGTVSGVLRVSATPFVIAGTLVVTGLNATFDVDQDASVAGLLTLTSGGAVDVALGATLTASAAMPAISMSSGTLRSDGAVVAAGGVDASGASSLAGSGLLTAPVAISGGTTTVLAGANLALTGGLSVAASAQLDAQGALIVAGSATVDGAVTTASGGLLEISNPNLLSFNNASSFTCAGTLRAAAGLVVDQAVTAAGTGSVDAPVVLNAGATLTITAAPTLSFTGGAQVPATSALVVTGAASFAGAVALDGGTLDVDGTLGASAINATSAASIDGTGTINAALSYTGPGTATIVALATPTFTAGGTITGGTLAVLGAPVFTGMNSLSIVSSILDVDGSLQAAAIATGPAAALNGPGLITANLTASAGITTAADPLTLVGDLAVSVGAALTLDFDLDVQGDVAAAGTVDGAGHLVLAGSGPTTFSAAGVVTAAVDVDAGTGVVTTTAGASSLVGAFDVQSGTFVVAAGSSLSANGGAALSGGTLQVDGTLSGSSLTLASGAVNGAGVVDLTVVVTGAVACGFGGTFFQAAPPPSALTLTVAVGGALTVSASPKVNGPISVLGTLTLSVGAVLHICSDLIVDVAGTFTGAGTLSIDGPAGSPPPLLGGPVGVNVLLTGTGGVSLAPGLSITGSLTIAPGAGALIIPLGSTITLGGPLALNGGTFQIDGVVNATGGVTITANVTFSGAGALNGTLSITGGTTNIAPPATFTLGGPATIAAGAVLQIDGAANLTVPGQVVVNGLLHVLSTGALNAGFSAPSIVVDGGTVDVDAGGSAVAADGVTAQGAGATFLVDGSLSTTAGALVLSVSTTIDGAGQYQAPVDQQTGVATFPATASPTFTQAFAAATGTTLTLTAGATPTVAGAFTSSGTLQVPTGSTLTASGPAPSATFTDLIVDLDGTFAAQNGASCGGAMTLDGVGQWNGDTTVTGGTTTIQPGSALVFGGAFAVQGGQADFQDGSTVTGLVSVGPGATLHVATGETLLVQPAVLPAVAVDGGTLDIDGVLDAALGSTLTGAASLDGAGGSITGLVTTTGGISTLLAGSSLSFAGGLSVTGGTFDAAATTSFGGPVTVTNAALSVATGTVFTANGPAASVVSTDSTATVAGTLVATNGMSVSGTSVLQGAGSIQGDVSSPGATTFPLGSSLTITGAMTIPGPGTVTVAGALTNGGQTSITGGGLSIASGATLAAQGATPSVSVTSAALDVDGTLTPTAGVSFQGISQFSGTQGVIEGAVQIVSGTTTSPGGTTVTMRDLLVGGAGVDATLDAQMSTQLNVVDAGAALCRVAGPPGVATMTCFGLTADALTVEGSFTKASQSGISLSVTGPTLVAAGGVANVAGSAAFAGTEVFGTLSAANGADFNGTLGARAGGLVQLQGASTATSIEVDGQLTSSSTLGVSGLFDVRAGATAVVAGTTAQSLLVGGQLTVTPGPSNVLGVTTTATVTGPGSQLTAQGPGALDVDGDVAVQNGGTFDGTNGTHFFGGNLTCNPGGTLVFSASTTFTFDGATAVVADCPSLPNTTCSKSGGGGLTLNGGTTVNGLLQGSGGALVLAGGGTVTIASVCAISDGTFATTGGTKGDIGGLFTVSAPNPAVTAAADLDLASSMLVNGSFRPTAGTVTFDGAVQVIARTPLNTGPVRFHRVVVATGSTVFMASADMRLRDDLTLDGTLSLSGTAGPPGVPNLDVRGDFTVSASGVFIPNATYAMFAGDFTCANPLGLPQSGPFPNTVFEFGPSGDFLANPTDATAPPTNRSTLVRSDAALPSVVLSGRGTLGFVQLAEFATQSCPGGDLACVTTRAFKVNGSFTQSADPGVTTLLHSSAAAPGTPSFSLDVQGAATLAGGGFLCCTAQDFAIFRSGAQWTGATCDSIANVICYGDWAATPSFAPSQGTVELRGDGSLSATNPGVSTTLHFATLSVKADPGSTARREVVGGVRFEAGLTSSASAVIIGAGAELAVEPAAPTFFAALLESVDATFLVQGTLAVGANGRLNFGPSSALTVPAGATLRLRGAASQPRAALGGVGGQNGWSATIGGTLDAERFLVEDLGSAGFVVQSAATLTSFTDGIFRRSTQLPGNSYLLDLRRPASSTPFVVQSMEFGDVGFPTASSNQTTGPLSVRTSLGGANVRFENWSGTLGGNFQDDDPFEASPAFAAVGGKVEWGAQAPTVLANFTAVGASSKVVAAFTVYSETPGTTFVVERSSQPTGPFVTAAAMPCTGALSYVCVDDPLAPGSMYHYRLVEQAPGVQPRVLGVASAVPFAADFATAPNVFEVGPGFPYATPQAAIDAAVLGQVSGAVVRLPAGVYPSFVVSATPPGGIRILADGAVVIDTANGPVLLTGLQADDRVVLHGLAIGSSASTHPAVVVQNSVAPVVIAACTLVGGAGQPGLSAAATYGLALSDVDCTGTPGVAFSASVGAAWDGSTNALNLGAGSKLRAAGFVATATSVDATSLFDLLAGPAPRLETEVFAPLGVPASFTFAAEPNAPWLAAAAFDLAYQGFVGAPIDLPLLVDAASVFLVDLRWTDGAGEDGFVLGVPADPILIGVVVSFQGVAYLPSVGRYRCSSPAVVVVAP